MRLARIVIAAALTVGLWAGTAWAHGDLPPDVCVASDGVHGATRGKYGPGPGHPWVETGSPVPLIRLDVELAAVGGPGWDRPVGQIPECPRATTTTTTSPQATTTTTVPAAVNVPTSTSSARATTSTTFDITDIERNVGTHAPSYGPGELPETGAGWVPLAIAGVALVLSGVSFVRGARTARKVDDVDR